MKTYKPAITDEVLAAVALLGKRFIGVDGNYCGAGLKALGASELATAAAEQCPVITDGIALVEAGGAITVSTNPIAVKSDSTGRAVAATAMTATVPSGATGVTSSGAQPAMTIAGSVVAEAINGWAIDIGTFAAGDFIRVRLA